MSLLVVYCKSDKLMLPIPENKTEGWVIVQRHKLVQLFMRLYPMHSPSEIKTKQTIVYR